MNKSRHHPTIRSRLFLFCLSLIIIWLSCYIAFSFLHWQYSRKLMSISDIQEEFAQLYSSLNELDRNLYHYCSREDESLPVLQETITDNMADLESSMTRLRETIALPVVEDFYHMMLSYSACAADILSVREGLSSTELADLYENSAKLRQFLENGYIRLWSVIHEYCEQQRLSAQRMFRKTNYLSILISVCLTVLSIFVSFQFSGRLLEPILSAIETLRREEHVLRKNAASAPTALNEPAAQPAARYLYQEAVLLNEALTAMLNTEHQDILIRERNSQLQQQLQLERLQKVRVQYQYAEARFQAMQSLVNPHFLFNTLSVISDLALTEQAPQTQNAIGKLSVFLRYSLSHLNQFVSLDEEVDYLRTFFDIQKLRFGNRYRFRIEMDPDCASLKVPAIILQPLAENSLSHGIGSYQSGGWIHFSICLEQKRVRIVCSDNGVGMDAGSIERIHETVRKGLEDKPEHGIGLLLVYYRMHNAFGNDFEMSVESTPDVRTDITLEFAADHAPNHTPDAKPEKSFGRKDETSVKVDADPAGQKNSL